jgi:hypothetical protein
MVSMFSHNKARGKNKERVEGMTAQIHQLTRTLTKEASRRILSVLDLILSTGGGIHLVLCQLSRTIGHGMVLIHRFLLDLQANWGVGDALSSSKPSASGNERHQHRLQVQGPARRVFPRSCRRLS